MEKYNHQEIEKNWQAYWEKHPELCVAQDDSKKEKKYILDMFPYPSGEGLHVGHVESYTATDIISRYWRMRGKNVLHPQGFDAFGLPAENYAVKTGIHPVETTKKAIANFKKQMSSLGLSYDWSREVNSSDPEYYKWTQWFFLLLYKKGLAYKKKAKVNWCEKCQTVLANEQAEGGHCERCGSLVAQKDLEQWFFKIMDFIEDRGETSGLISGLEKVDWPESTKLAQLNWIGKSEGVQFKLPVADSQEVIDVFTTRIDTVFGMTYAVAAPEHATIQKLKDRIKNWGEVEEYLEASKRKTDLDRMEAKEKTGVKLEGIEVVNPFNQEKIPLFVADYVLSHYGTGAVMAVPAHDERDFEFARKYGLPIKQVIKPISDKKISGIGVILESSEGNLILQRRDENTNRYPEMIAPFGGGLNEGEDILDGARRELKEELGLSVENSDLMEIGDFESRFEKDKAVRMFYLKGIDPAKLKLAEGAGIVEVSSEDSLENEKVTDFTKEVIKFLQNTFTDDGVLIASREHDGLASEQAREKMAEWLEKEGIGQKKINYKLRDWLVSRQRYWGAPIPIIYCEKCGVMPVPENDLPVLLPDDVDFKPTGESPLKYSKKFHDVKCPACGRKAQRESDTMDTFVCSSWYYFRYADPKNEKEFAGKEAMKKWLPVDLYMGGAEHTVLHLLYARFFTKVLHSFGFIDFDEPFAKLRHQGIILAEDGTKMSKSKGNVVNPDEVVQKYGADSLRLFEMFMGPIEEMKPWNTKGIMGVTRFLEKVWRLGNEYVDLDIKEPTMEESSIGTVKNNTEEKTTTDKNYLKIVLNKTTKKVTDDIEALKFNTAISSLMIFVKELGDNFLISDRRFFEDFLKILSPFAPHLAEELWRRLDHKESIFKETWPEYDEKLLVEDKVKIPVMVNGKLRDTLLIEPEAIEEEVQGLALENEKVKKWLEGKTPKKFIYVKGRVVNIVI